MHHIITSEPISDYAENFSKKESQTLFELNQQTQLMPGAQMISGHLQGVFLEMISCMIQPRNILEIGTYTGYSAICLAKGLKPDGKVHTIDRDRSIQGIRDDYWEKAGLDKVIQQHLGDAAIILQSLKEIPFDLIFIDADKGNYGLYYDLLIETVPSGTIFLADNVLFHGEVILPEDQQSKSAKAIHQFNKKIAEDKRVEQVLLPIRDGVSIIRKIA